MGKRRRRFAHLNVSDVALLNALEPDAAAEMERYLRSVHRAERAYRAHVVPECSLAGDVSIESIADDRAARASHGAGGGRRAGGPHG